MAADSQSSNYNVVHPVDIESPVPATPPVSRAIVIKQWVWLIPTFVMINVIMFVITMYINNCPKNSVSCMATFLGRFSFQPFKENPLLGPSSASLQKMGALDVKRVVDDHQVWLLITCNWLHAGVLHLLGNMFVLWVIGYPLQQNFGFMRIGMLYVISGLGGSLMSSLFIRSNISVGASGAIFGLIGAMLSELITNWTLYPCPRNYKFLKLVFLLLIIAISLAPLLPNVDNFAHIGGLLSGFFSGFLFLIYPQLEWVKQRYASPEYRSSSEVKYSKFKTYQCICWILSLVILIVGFTAGLVMLLRGVDANKHCSWCRYLSCIPTKGNSCKYEPAYCLSTQISDQLLLKCSRNGKNGTYPYPNASNSQIMGLCSQLCS